MLRHAQRIHATMDATVQAATVAEETRRRAQVAAVGTAAPGRRRARRHGPGRTTRAPTGAALSAGAHPEHRPGLRCRNGEGVPPAG